MDGARGDFDIQLKVIQSSNQFDLVLNYKADLPPTPTLKRTMIARPTLHQFVRIIIPTQALVYRNIPSFGHR